METWVRSLLGRFSGIPYTEEPGRRIVQRVSKNQTLLLTNTVYHCKQPTFTSQFWRVRNCRPWFLLIWCVWGGLAYSYMVPSCCVFTWSKGKGALCFCFYKGTNPIPEGFIPSMTQSPFTKAPTLLVPSSWVLSFPCT